jgi:hypothetical protein
MKRPGRQDVYTYLVFQEMGGIWMQNVSGRWSGR